MPETGNEKPLVLRFVSRMAVGGVQNGIIETLRRADRSRYRYAVLCYKKKGKWADQLEAIGIPVYVQKALPIWDPYQIWRLSRVIREIGPDLIHVYMAPSVIVGVTAARLAEVDRIVIHHNSLYGERHWSKQNAVLRRWEKNATQRADALIAVSQAVEAESKRWMEVVPGRVRIVPNGIDLDRWGKVEPIDLRAELSLPSSTPLVGLVARYLEVKRIEDFIDAAAIVGRNAAATEGRPKPVFLVIGGGPDHLGDPLKRRASRIQHVADVRFLGERMDVAELLPNLDVGVLASEVEGCPNTILEYMAAGVPIAATAIAPIEELVSNQREALLSPVRDPKSLAQNIVKLLTDRDLARELVDRARLKSRTYDWRETQKAYEEIYDRVMKRPRL